VTDELEDKLKDLSALKEQLDRLSREQLEAATSAVLERYKKEAKAGRIRLWVGIMMSIVFLELGWVGLNSTGPWANLLVGIGVLGLYIPVGARLGFVIKQSKLAVLQEMKQFELRMTELLQHRP
jgi:hypothetical protein